MGKIVVLLFGCTLAEAFLSTNVLPRTSGMSTRSCIMKNLRKPLHQVTNTLQLLKTKFLPIYSGKFNTKKSLGKETDAPPHDKFLEIYAAIVTMNATIQSMKADIKAITEKNKVLRTEQKAMIKILTTPQNPQTDSEVTAALNVSQAASERIVRNALIANNKVLFEQILQDFDERYKAK